MVRTYLRIEPTREQVVPTEIVKRLEGLRNIENSFTNKVNPLKSPPKFEFLILTEGGGEEIKFYCGVDKERHLQGLKSELIAAYPDSYDIYKESVSLRAELTPTDYPGTDGDQNPLDAVQASDEDTDDDLPTTADDTTIQDFEDATLHSVCWYGVEDRRGDWMTTLKEFEEQVDDDGDNSRSPVASVIENLSQIQVPVALQVLFQRRADWEGKAERRKNRIRGKVDGPVRAVKTTIGDMFGNYDREERRERHKAGDVTDIGEDAVDHEKETGSAVRSRSALIDIKGPNRTFIANIRATAVVPDRFPKSIQDSVKDDLSALSNSFNLLDGPFYSTEGRLVDEQTFSHRSNKSVFENILTRDLSRTAGLTTRPQLVLNGDELANFVTVPSLEALTSEGARGTRGEGEYRTPLDLPDPDILSRFHEDGVKLTFPLNQRGETIDDPVRLPFNSLSQHFTIASRTGSGKSMLTQSIMLSLAKETQGPNVVFNPKEDFMLQNYMRSHYDTFGNLEDVIYFDVGETIPCIPFFDIRPLLAAGNSREDAIQYKKKQFKDIMVQAMGEGRYDQAFVGVTILNLLIEALFDPVHGDDAFTLNELQDALKTISDEGRAPEVSDRFQHVGEELTRYLNQSDQAEDSFEAAENRLAVIANHHKLRKFFNQLPEWDGEKEKYADEGFHFKELLDTDKTLLFDIGGLHAETQRVLTTVVLTNIWDAVRFRNTGRSVYQSTPDNYCTNIIIDEAADLASTRIVSEEFLPQGRGYDLGLGLIEQFPDQIGEDSQSTSQDEKRAYRELLNNVHTKLIGNIAITGRQAELLAFEGVDEAELQKRINDMAPGNWFTELPSPAHFENPPKPFYSQSPPIPSGHPEGPDPLTEYQEQKFQQEALPRVIQRTKRNYSSSRPDRGTSEGSTSESEPGKDVDPNGFSVSSMFEDESNSPESVREESQPESVPGSAESDGGSSLGGDVETSASQEETTPVPSANRSPSTSESRSVPETGADPESNQNTGTTDSADTVAGRDADGEVLPPSQSTVVSPTRGSDSSEQSKDMKVGSPGADETDDKPFRQHFISDEEIAKADLERTDVRFLGLVHDAMQDEVPGYSLLDPMSKLPYYEEADIDALLEKDFLEESNIGPRKYFTVTPDGREFLGEKRQFGAGVGDLGEKIVHIVGVRLLATYFENVGQVDRTEIYYESDSGDAVFDVAAFSSARSAPVWVGEVETDTNNRESIRHDYEKMAESPAIGTWLVDTQDTLQTVASALEHPDAAFEGTVDFSGNPTYSDIRSQLAEFDDSGFSRVYGIAELFREVS
jgi:DNA helicase HerA-like ATPase